MKKAIILAAGFGSRLAPLTREVPKPLIPLHGTPMIIHLLRRLKSWGVEEVLINLHHGTDILLRDIPPQAPAGLRLQFSYEPEILGTGGALRRMAWFFGQAPLWLANADALMDLDPAPLLRAHRRHHPLATLWMIPGQGPRTVRIGPAHRILDFRSSGGLTFSGLHLLSPRILDFIPPAETFSSIITAYESALAAGETLLGLPVPGSRWADIGTPDQLLDAEGGSVILPGAHADPRATLHRAILGPGTRIRARRTAAGLIIRPATALTPAENAWVPDAEAVEFLPARGSDRTFRRIHTPRRTCILMTCGTARPENQRFTPHTRYLARNHIRVPAILRHTPQAWLLEDAGRIHLLDAPTPANTRKAIALTARLHNLRTWTRLDLEPAFSPALYTWEHRLFFDEFLSRHAPGTDPAPLQKLLSQAAQRLLREPPVLVHRDLQSTNILFHRREAVLIDYQGMRPGPAAYDLASLLADPYLDRPLAQQFTLLRHYNTLARHPVSEDAYRAAVLQRLAQALGAYGRLGARPETRRFLTHIPPALRQLASHYPDSPLQTLRTEFFERQTVKNPLGSPL